MPCYYPIPALRPQSGGPWILWPKKSQHADGHTVENTTGTVPCGKCLGCRTRLQLEWTLRCVHEAQQYEHNRFITLTYDDQHLPNELVPYHLTTFFKRLRNYLNPTARNIRYLACGEYGENTLRPHYHANIFNLHFDDEKPYSQDLSSSATLDRIWGHGAAKLAPFTAATAGYVAGYITQHGHRTYTDSDGVELQPPFKRQSSRPAIGRAWLDKHAANLQHGYIIHEGQKRPIPRYYKRILSQTGGKYLQHLEDTTATPATPTDKYTPERLADAQYIHQDNLKRKGKRQDL